MVQSGFLKELFSLYSLFMAVAIVLMLWGFDSVLNGNGMLGIGLFILGGLVGLLGSTVDTTSGAIDTM